MNTEEIMGKKHTNKRERKKRKVGGYQSSL
jgi:hypothetical protein